MTHTELKRATSHEPLQPYPPLPLIIGHSPKKKKKTPQNPELQTHQPTNLLTHDPRPLLLSGVEAQPPVQRERVRADSNSQKEKETKY